MPCTLQHIQCHGICAELTHMRSQVHLLASCEKMNMNAAIVDTGCIIGHTHSCMTVYTHEQQSFICMSKPKKTISIHGWLDFQARNTGFDSLTYVSEVSTLLLHAAEHQLRPLTQNSSSQKLFLTHATNTCSWQPKPQLQAQRYFLSIGSLARHPQCSNGFRVQFTDLCAKQGREDGCKDKRTFIFSSRLSHRTRFSSCTSCCMKPSMVSHPKDLVKSFVETLESPNCNCSSTAATVTVLVREHGGNMHPAGLDDDRDESKGNNSILYSACAGT